MNDLAVEFPENVKLVIAGKSYEGRDIKGIKLSFKNGNKAVFMEGGLKLNTTYTTIRFVYKI